jgi:pimeloyl-ACP methyl ester carboxylesterase
MEGFADVSAGFDVLWCIHASPYVLMVRWPTSLPGVVMASPGFRWRRRGAAIAVLLTCALVATPTAAPAAPAPDAEAAVSGAAVPRLDWRPCGEVAPAFECTTARVPLDYDRPRGAQITLALTRLPASDRANRIGSLFLNPGGPGGSGVGFAWGAGQDLYSAEVRARFDIVGFDPRGVDRSTPLQCFDSPDDAIAVLAPFAFPYTPEEERIWVQADRAYAAACRDRAGPIIDHMSTANVARDMDLLRRAVGDDKMTFAGYSYGSYIGSTYANMFPNKVRAVIIDAVIDPVSYATGRGNEAKYLPVDARLVSEQGAYQTLQQFLLLCDRGGATCAFSDGDPKRRYDALAQRLIAEPAQLPDGEGGTVPFTYADLVGTTLGAMYDTGSWPDLAAFLQELDTLASPAAAAAGLKALKATQSAPDFPEQPPYQQVLEGFAGVWCLDGANPDNAGAWARAARNADRRWPYFGRAWIWGSSICASWPGKDRDRYAGPFNRHTANDVLVIGNRYDPATRYQDAVSTARMLPDSTLVTLEGWGHTSLFLSACVDDHVNRYLLTGRAPARDVTCQPDAVPFASAAARSGGSPRTDVLAPMIEAARPTR